MKIMTWNCQGLEAADKFNQLVKYRSYRGVDMVFVQEGSSKYDATIVDNGKIMSCNEKNGVSISSTFSFGSSDSTGRVLQAAFGKPNHSGVTGDGSDKTYTVIHPPLAGGSTLSPSTPDYATSPGVKAFIVETADQWVGANDAIDGTAPGIAARAAKAKAQEAEEGELEVAAKAKSGGKIVKKKERSVPFYVKENRRGAGYMIDRQSGRAAIDQHVKTPTEKRINLLGRRRPRLIDVAINGSNYRLYFFHSPLGSAGTLEDMALTASYAECKGHASGGDIAIITNILFAKYLEIKAVFPANTILLGDLNIDATAAAAIYKTTNIASSLDGWCHIIAPAELKMTQINTGDFKKVSEKEYPSTLTDYGLLKSDHSPVMVDIAIA